MELQKQLSRHDYGTGSRSKNNDTHTPEKEKYGPTSMSTASPRTNPIWAQRLRAGLPSNTSSGRKWELVTSRKTKKQAREETDISPRNLNTSAERRIIIERKNEKGLCPAPELVVAMNAALSKANAPAHIRIQKVEANKKGTVSACTGPKATGIIALNFKEALLKAARGVDNNIEQMKTNETWHKLKLHAVNLNRYYHSDNGEEVRERGRSHLKEDIENAYPN
ncbi:hypothetical protein EX30DRAFT_346291 [Ascodesmis nigricans]|uniref:Uncharacterized protein n=1 Tax=Ascodesmis nigricans TaxID=341454 RepID=A0A4S2N314_9PEZI|nr:hypothetical protein EX30DRAFT_346291 [Ascodesmis nigricans]